MGAGESPFSVRERLELVRNGLSLSLFIFLSLYGSEVEEGARCVHTTSNHALSATARRGFLDRAAVLPHREEMRDCISLALMAVAFLALGGLCAAQLPTNHSLSLSVNVTATGGAANSSGSVLANAGGVPLGGGWVSAQTIDASQTRVQGSGISLTVQVRNLGRTLDSAKLEWYFVARRVGSKGKDYMFENDSQDIKVDAAGSIDFLLKSRLLQTFVSKEMHSSNGVNPNTGQPVGTTATMSRGGDSIAGWIVRLVIDGKPVEIRASSPTLEAVARSDAQLNAFPRGSAMMPLK